MKYTQVEDPVLSDPISASAMCAPNGEGEFDVLEILIVLARRKRFILFVTLGAAILTCILTLCMSNRYTATSKIMPPKQSQSSAGMLLDQLAGANAGALASMAGKDIGLKNPSDLYIGMLKSRTVEDAIISKFKLSDVYGKRLLSDTRGTLEGSTDIDSGRDGLISISVQDKDPNRAADIANAYVEQLRFLSKTLAISEAGQRRLFFEDQVAQAKEALADAEVGLKETQQKTGMIDLDAQSKILIEAIGSLRGQIAAKEVQVQAMQSFATDKNPDLVIVRQEISGLRQQLSQFERQSQGGNGDPVVATAKIPAVALEYIRKFREVKYRETVLALLTQQLEMARLDESKEATLIQVLDPAVVPDKKSSPKRALIVLLVTFMAFSCSCIWAFLMESIELIKADPIRAERLSNLRSHLFRSSRLIFARDKRS